jgi:hypothetical protein
MIVYFIFKCYFFIWNNLKNEKIGKVNLMLEVTNLIIIIIVRVNIICYQSKEFNVKLIYKYLIYDSIDHVFK